MSDIKIAVTSLVSLNGGADLSLTVRISNGENFETRKLILSTRRYAELSIEKGEISEEQLEILEYEAELYSAVRRGMLILGYGASSRKNLALKLRSKGFSGDIAREAAEYLERLGYVNEEQDAFREAERATKKYWGKRRIAASLFEKGYSSDAVEHAVAALEDVDFVGLCASLVRKRFGELPEDQPSRKKIFSALIRYGYSPSEIKEAFLALDSDGDD